MKDVELTLEDLSWKQYGDGELQTNVRALTDEIYNIFYLLIEGVSV
jgi:hypothetical protein